MNAGSIPTSASIYFLARMAKLVDARDLKSCGHCDRAGSIPAPGTIHFDDLPALQAILKPSEAY